MKNQDLRDRTKQFASRIIRMFSMLQKNTVAQILGNQVLRSGTSVGANYREACRARSKAEFISKSGDCLRELDETMYWLELIIENKIIHEKKLSALLDETNQLTAIFVTILNNSKSGPI